MGQSGDWGTAEDEQGRLLHPHDSVNTAGTRILRGDIKEGHINKAFGHSDRGWNFFFGRIICSIFSLLRHCTIPLTANCWQKFHNGKYGWTDEIGPACMHFHFLSFLLGEGRG